MADRAPLMRHLGRACNKGCLDHYVRGKEKYPDRRGDVVGKNGNVVVKNARLCAFGMIHCRPGNRTTCIACDARYYAGDPAREKIRVKKKLTALLHNCHKAKGKRYSAKAKEATCAKKRKKCNFPLLGTKEGWCAHCTKEARAEADEYKSLIKAAP